jgi:hypothetical protein
MFGTTTAPAFKKDDMVYFGRTHGEKTLGKIKKVNPKKYKIEQMEDRGSIRDYKIGTIWTVPFNLVSAAPGTVASTPVASTPPVARTTATSTVRPGDRAEFTQGRTVVTGTVKSVNVKTVTLVDCDDNSRGYRVPFRMIRPAATKTTVAAPPSHSFKVGNTVTFTNRQGNVVAAVVTKLDAQSVFVYGDHRFGVESPKTASELTLAPKRANAAIMSDICSMYSNLSPENLHCDGEISVTQARHRATVFNRILKALFAEYGRTVSESEAFSRVSA